MKATITILMDNSAFEHNSEGTELARILRCLADEIDYAQLDPKDQHNLRDYNGNRVGELKITGTKSKE